MNSTSCRSTELHTQHHSGNPWKYIQYLLLAAIVLGILMRLYRFFIFHHLWGDEAYIAINIIERNFVGLTEPLDNRQVAPPGFLILIKCVFESIHQLWSMRILPLAAGLISIPLFGWCILHLFNRRVALWSTALFSVTLSTIFYSTEIKPYTIDALCSVLLLLPALLYINAPTQNRWLYIPLICVAPMVWISFTSSIVICSIGVILVLFTCWHRVSTIRTHQPLSLYQYNHKAILLSATAMLFIISGILLYFLVIKPNEQSISNEKLMEDWTFLDAFPPIDRPWLLPWWFISVHTGKMLSYPWGGKHFGSILSFALCLSGIWTLVTKRNWWLLGLLVSPFIMGILFAALHIYPYGRHIRIMLYLAPFVTLLMGIGIEGFFAWYKLKKPQHADLMILALAIAFFVTPIGMAIKETMQSYNEFTHGNIGQLLGNVNHKTTDNDLIACYNTLDPHTGSGPEIQFELYMMRKIDHQIHDSGLLPLDKQQPGSKIFAISFHYNLDPEAHQIQEWLDRIGQNAKWINRQRAKSTTHTSEFISVDEFVVQAISD